MYYQNQNSNKKKQPFNRNRGEGVYKHQKKQPYDYNRGESIYKPKHEVKEKPAAPLRVVHDRKPSANIIAGRNPVLEALRGGTIIEKVVILGGVKGSAIERIRLLAKRNKIQCVEVGKQKFRDLVSDTTTQGVVAIVGNKRYVEVDEIIKIAEEKNEAPFVLLLDEVEDPHNLGALIRTAECAGVHGVVIPKHHAATVNQTVSKTSAGASEHVAVAKVTNIVNTIDELKQKGIWVIGTDSNAEKLFTEVDYTSPVAIVVGNEGKGIRQLVKEKCDIMVKIPLLGKIASLNASVAGALVMYEIVKKRKIVDGKLIEPPPAPEIEVEPEINTPQDNIEEGSIDDNIEEEPIDDDIDEETIDDNIGNRIQ